MLSPNKGCGLDSRSSRYDGPSRVRKDGQGGSPKSHLERGISDGSTSSEDDASMQPGNDTSRAAENRAGPSFPGFFETEFSCATDRYYYKETTQRSLLLSGSFAKVRTVYWLNPETGELELWVAKSCDIAKGMQYFDDVEGFQAAVDREVAALQRLAGVPGVPGFQNLVKGLDGTLHIIMEEGPGYNLKLRLGYRALPKYGLSWQQMRTALRLLAEVLADCHERGVVHGDIKPDNIIVSKDWAVTLVDFGMASIRDGSGWKYHGGTLPYLAPELLLSARRKRAMVAPPLYELQGPPVDCWAYGVVAMQLLTGCCLFKTKRRDREMPPEFEGQDAELWDVACTANLQEEWETGPGSSAIHATFQRSVELLAAASEEYKRAGTDFLRGLLHPDPTKRLTAAGALRHPFLTSPFSEVAEGTMPADIEKDLLPKTSGDRALWDALEKKWKEIMGEKGVAAVSAETATGGASTVVEVA